MSTASGTPHDAGMRAVARVRSVREQDSRIGLQQALHEHRAHEARAAELGRRLETADVFGSGSAASFLARRESLRAISAALQAARIEAAASRNISEAAYSRWQYDKTRLSAVETLLDRRSAERLSARAHREARELDEIAIQRWQRRATEPGGER